MINYIVYGNTDYLDVLQIQTDYMAGRGYLTLFINTNTLDMVDIYSKYDKVIFYNGQNQYARRLLTCLEQIDYDYFLFLHDIDILLAADTNMLEKFKDFLSINNFDRVDLKYNDKFTDETMLIKINENTDPSEWPIMFKDEMTDGTCASGCDEGNATGGS